MEERERERGPRGNFESSLAAPGGEARQGRHVDSPAGRLGRPGASVWHPCRACACGAAAWSCRTGFSGAAEPAMGYKYTSGQAVFKIIFKNWLKLKKYEFRQLLALYNICSNLFGVGFLGCASSAAQYTALPVCLTHGTALCAGPWMGRGLLQDPFNGHRLWIRHTCRVSIIYGTTCCSRLHSVPIRPAAKDLQRSYETRTRIISSLFDFDRAVDCCKQQLSRTVLLAIYPPAQTRSNRIRVRTVHGQINQIKSSC